MALRATRIQLCGRLAVDHGGQRVEGRLPGRQGRLLFGYLVANWDRAITRDELCFALWGDDLPSDVDSSFNALVSKLRRAVGTDRLVGRSDLRFVPAEGTVVDMHWAIDALHRSESHVRAGRWGDGWQPGHTAFEIGSRQFLLGHDAPWIDEWRRHLEDVAVRGLECHVRCYLATAGADPITAERAARLLVRRAPFRESGYALLMETVARQGNPAEALRIYEELSTLLREELGISPGPDVTAVRDRLLGIPSGA